MVIISDAIIHYKKLKILVIVSTTITATINNINNYQQQQRPIKKQYEQINGEQYKVCC